ncbi:phage minor capsid protein [Priestia megaterium]
MPKKFDDIPFPVYEKKPDKITQLYADSWARITKEVYRLSGLPSLPSSQYTLLQNSIIATIAAVFKALKSKALQLAVPMVTDAYLEGLAYSRFALGQYDTLEEAKRDTPIINRTRLNKIITDTQTDLLKATNNTEENVKKMVRTSVARAVSSFGKNVKRDNVKDKIKEELSKQMIAKNLDESNIAIIDRAHRKWKLDTYIDMACNTKIATSYMDGIREEAMNNGNDLAIITSHPLTTDACKGFEGMIISLNGMTSGYATYDELKRSKLIFHPNCRHFARPVGGLNMIPPSYIEKHNQLKDKYDKYIQSQS